MTTKKQTKKLIWEITVAVCQEVERMLNWREKQKNNLSGSFIQH